MNFLRSLFRRADEDGFSQATREDRSVDEAVDRAADFGLSRRRAEQIYIDERRRLFGAVLDSAFNDNRFHDDWLLEQASRLGLPDADAWKAIAAYRTGKVTTLVNEILEDGQVDPAEDARLQALLMQLGGVSLGDDTAALIQDARDMRNAIAGELPDVEAPILLKSGEVCHFVVEAEAAENRQRTVRVNYAGPSARIRIAKGFSYNIGSMNVSRTTEDFEHSFGQGALCMTNKRLLWISPQRTITVPLPSIVHYESFADAIRVRKGTGKPVTFYWGKPRKIATVMAVRIMEQYRA